MSVEIHLDQYVAQYDDDGHKINAVPDRARYYAIVSNADVEGMAIAEQGEAEYAEVRLTKYQRRGEVEFRAGIEIKLFDGNDIHRGDRPSAIQIDPDHLMKSIELLRDYNEWTTTAVTITDRGKEA